ncbi:MAG: 4Fe-4S dicluster domain-containing protein [Marinilabiliales bacterium]|nr:4Fe-4S dicluster domain-containing protein [Marinilabiliales bacterium]
MGFDRRDFFKTMCVAGITLAAGKSFGEATSGKEPVEFQGMLYDSTRCLGCRACERVCAKAHNLPEPQDELKAGVLRKTSETQRSVINNFITSKGEVFARKSCMHCNEPACTAACLTEAMYKTKEGPVIWRGEKCMGCRYCMVSCPFDVPKFEFHSNNPKIQKCDLCYDRIKEGKLPACAEACPGDALTFGTRRELIAEARKRIFENPKDYVNQIYGEEVAGGTGLLYLAPAPFSELGFNPKLQTSSYPALTKGFLYSVPSVDVLLPPLLLAIYEATKTNQKDEDNE